MSKRNSRLWFALQFLMWGKRSHYYWQFRQWWREIPAERVYTVQTRA